jgi:phytoene synthase
VPSHKDVEAAYAEAERITREQAKNFAWGIRLLPSTKRAALSAVYAMARRIDDIGDGDLPDDQKLERLAEVRRNATEPGAHPADPVCVALADAASKLPIPLGAFGELVDGCEMDVTGRTYETFDDLVVYCRCVAGSIGRLSLGVFHPGLGQAAFADAAQLADDLGVALQITNILRDIREDFGNGRTYLPKHDLDLFGVSLRVRTDGTLDPQDGRLAELIRFEAARAMGWYDRGLRLIPYLDRRSAACVSAMSGIYRELLQRISEQPDIVMRERVSLSTSQKVRVAGKSLLTAHFDYQRGRKAVRG